MTKDEINAFSYLTDSCSVLRTEGKYNSEQLMTALANLTVEQYIIYATMELKIPMSIETKEHFIKYISKLLDHQSEQHIATVH